MFYTKKIVVYVFFYNFAGIKPTYYKLMKHYHCLSLLTLVLSTFLFFSCGDDDGNIGIGPDTGKAITGYWQVGDRDLNGDAAITGIVVHDDGTVTEWQYAEGAEDPFSLGYKTGKWTVSGNHYELQLSRGDGSFYTVTVAGNDDREMYLAYNGRTSIVPMLRLSSLPGDGNSMIQELERMKFANFTMSDVTGYWEYAENNSGAGIYIDNQGNLSDVSPVYSDQNYKAVQYHSGILTLTPSACSFLFKGSTYTVYAVGGDTMLASTDGRKVERFVRKDVPAEVATLENIFRTAPASALLGTWESIHYKYEINGNTNLDIDITPSDNWAMQYYKKLVFSADHKLHRYTYHSGNSYDDLYFSYVSGVIRTASTPGELVMPDPWGVSTWQVESLSDTELRLSHNGETYTFRKTN
jgi:hypothetical protein